MVSSPQSEALRVEASDGGSSKILDIGLNVSSTRVEQLYTFKLDFKLYPNPARRQVTIETLAGHYNYRILDVTGQTLMSSTAAIHGSLTIDLDQEPGVYLVELYNEKEHKVQKLIIAE